MALLSPGTVFLLQAMETTSRILSARAPVIFLERKSTKTRCTSVPPVAMLYPLDNNPLANLLLLART